MADKAYVYILSLQDEDLLKIGRTVHLKKRITNLSLTYSFDLSKSFSVECLSERDSVHLESTLHKVFNSQRVLLSTPGGTEMFSGEIWGDLFCVCNIISQRQNIPLFNIGSIMTDTDEVSDTDRVFNAYCDAIKDARLSLNISQAELAEKSSVSKRTIERIENGKGDVGLLNYLKVARPLGVEIPVTFDVKAKLGKQRSSVSR